MRLNHDFSARLVASAAMLGTVALFASGRQVFASEQQPAQATTAAQQPAQTPAVPRPAEGGPQLTLTADEAVKMGACAQAGDTTGGRARPPRADQGVSFRGTLGGGAGAGDYQSGSAKLVGEEFA